MGEQPPFPGRQFRAPYWFTITRTAVRPSSRQPVLGKSENDSRATGRIVTERIARDYSTH